MDYRLKFDDLEALCAENVAADPSLPRILSPLLLILFFFLFLFVHHLLLPLFL